jgi:hypothetical protein
MDRIVPIVYDDLRLIARRHLRRELRSYDAPTSLVHGILKLANATALNAGDRAHFRAIAARAMRGAVDITPPIGLEVRDRGTDRLATGLERRLLGPEEIWRSTTRWTGRARQRQVVECRFSVEERDVETLGVTERTVRRDWVKARAWLYRALYGTTSA